MTTTYAREFRLEALCSVYNRATNPAALRTEHQHKRFTSLARAARNRLSAEGFIEGRHYAESDYSGRLLPIR